MIYLFLYITKKDLKMDTVSLIRDNISDLDEKPCFFKQHAIGKIEIVGGKGGVVI